MQDATFSTWLESLLDSPLGDYLARTLEFTAYDFMRAAILATIGIGFAGVLLKRNLLMKTLSMDIMSTGIITLYVLVASRAGRNTPTFVADRAKDYADPIPQAVILTAIVIGFSVLALLLVGLMALARRYPDLDLETIERDLT